MWRIVKTGYFEGEDGLRDSQRTHQIEDQNDRGDAYDCTGVPVGVVEDDHPREDCEVNYGGQRWLTDDAGQHITVVTECAASTEGFFPGAGRFADVYSADNLDNAADRDDMLAWMDNNNVVAVSSSRSYDDSRTYSDMDETWDEESFNRNLTLTPAASNIEDNDNDNCPVSTPGKSFNSITVGGANNQNTGDRSDDEIYDRGCDINPNSRNADPSRIKDPYPHNKPEVVASAVDIDTPYNTLQATDDFPFEEEFRSISGTSYAAPQVAGLLAIIENNTDFAVSDAPEVAKAVVMASATHDVEAGAFNRRGAGCIDADKAVDLVENGQYIEDIFYEANSAQDYFIDLNAGETLQLALCWQSNSRMADWSSPDNAQADINLDLYFYDPSGNILRGESGYDRAYQFMDSSSDDVTVDQTGTYQLKVWNSRWDADSSYRNFAIAWQTK